VDKQLRQMMNEAEQELLRQTEPDRLKKLDEDELIELHGRVRRARNKYSKLYRRRAAAKVTKDGARARASKVNQRTAMKAEVFEDTLARVSRRLARVAWLSADQLREERIAAARAVKGRAAAETGAKAKTKKGSKGSGAKKAKDAPTEKRRTPASTRDAAAARASTRRKQAKRDKR